MTAKKKPAKQTLSDSVVDGAAISNVSGDPDKWKKASAKARRTAKWAKTLTRWIITNRGSKAPAWRVIDFDGPLKAESRGIVDLIAIRKSHSADTYRALSGFKLGDLFELVLIQVKGGRSAKPTTEDIARLQAVATHHNASAVVLGEWKEGALPTIKLLKDGVWKKVSVSDVF